MSISSSSGHELLAGSRVRRNIGVYANLPANCSVGTRCYPLFFSCAAQLELQDFCGDDDVAS